MRWHSHKIIGGCVGAALGLPVPTIITIAASSILPDLIETPLGPRGPRLMRHRGASHELGWWLLLLAFAVPASGHPGFGWPVWAIPLGGVLHILADMFSCAGIRIFGRYAHYPMYRTGSFMETIYVGLILVVSVCAVKSKFLWALVH
jgi:membrane-bound metal-dependent hydrolase YbcI (DUF457 family)